MNNISKVMKYQLRDFKTAILIYYAIILAIILSLIIYKIFINPSDNAYFSGFGGSAVIFLFIAGLNSFKANFKFMLVNNVSRRNFFYGSFIAFAIVAFFMALIEIMINMSLNLIVEYEGLYEQLYYLEEYYYFADLLWSFTLFLFSVNLGLLITMLYYKSNKLMKTVISLIPAAVVILLIALNNLTGGAIINVFYEFYRDTLGFPNNSYIAVVSFTVATIGLLGLNFLLIRKMPIKD